MERQRRQAGTIAGAGRVDPTTSSNVSLVGQRDLTSSFDATEMSFGEGSRASATSAPRSDEQSRRLNEGVGSSDASGGSNNVSSTHGESGNVSQDDGKGDSELTAACEETARLLEPLLFNGQPALVQKLLLRPPFRYVHDIATSVAAGSTGFGSGLLEGRPDLIDSKAVSSRELKLEYLYLLVGLVSAALGTSVNVRPAKVLAGADPLRTNALLQSLARAATAANSNPSASRAAESAARASLAVAAAGPGGLGDGGGNDGEGRSKRRTGKGGPAPMPSPGAAASPVLAPRDKRSRRPRPGQHSDIGEEDGLSGKLAENEHYSRGGGGSSAAESSNSHSNSVDSRTSGAMGSVEMGGEVDFLRRGHLPSSRDRHRTSAQADPDRSADFYKPKLGASADGLIVGSSSSSNSHARASAVDASPSAPNEFGKRGRSRAVDSSNNDLGALPDFGARDGAMPNKSNNYSSGGGGSSSLFPTLTRPSVAATNAANSTRGPPPTTVGPTGELLQPLSGNDAHDRALLAQKMAAAFLDSEDDETSPRTARGGGASGTAAGDKTSNYSNGNQPVDPFGARAEERLRVMSRGSERRGGSMAIEEDHRSPSESSPGISDAAEALDSKGVGPAGGGQKKLTGLVDAPVPVFSPPMHPVERNAAVLAKPDSLYDFSSQPSRPGGGGGGGKGGGPPPNRPGTSGGKGKGKGKGGKGRHAPPGGGKGGWMASSSRPATTMGSKKNSEEDSDDDDDDDDDNGSAKKRNGSIGGLKGFYSPAGGLPPGNNGTNTQQPPPTLLVGGENDGGTSHNASIGSMEQYPSFRGHGPNGSHLRKKYSFNDPTPPPGKPSPQQKQQQQQHRNSYFHDDAKHSEASSQARQPRDPSIRPPGLTPTHAERVAAEAKAEPKEGEAEDKAAEKAARRRRRRHEKKQAAANEATSGGGGGESDDESRVAESKHGGKPRRDKEKHRRRRPGGSSSAKATGGGDPLTFADLVGGNSDDEDDADAAREAAERRKKWAAAAQAKEADAAAFDRALQRSELEAKERARLAREVAAADAAAVAASAAEAKSQGASQEEGFGDSTAAESAGAAAYSSGDSDVAKQQRALEEAARARAEAAMAAADADLASKKRGGDKGVLSRLGIRPDDQSSSRNGAGAEGDHAPPPSSAFLEEERARQQRALEAEAAAKAARLEAKELKRAAKASAEAEARAVVARAEAAAASAAEAAEEAQQAAAARIKAAEEQLAALQRAEAEAREKAEKADAGRREAEARAEEAFKQQQSQAASITTSSSGGGFFSSLFKGKKGNNNNSNSAGQSSSQPTSVKPSPASSFDGLAQTAAAAREEARWANMEEVDSEDATSGPGLDKEESVAMTSVQAASQSAAPPRSNENTAEQKGEDEDDDDDYGGIEFGGTLARGFSSSNVQDEEEDWGSSSSSSSTASREAASAHAARQAALNEQQATLEREAAEARAEAAAAEAASLREELERTRREHAAQQKAFAEAAAAAEARAAAGQEQHQQEQEQRHQQQQEMAQKAATAAANAEKEALAAVKEAEARQASEAAEAQRISLLEQARAEARAQAQIELEAAKKAAEERVLAQEQQLQEQKAAWEAERSAALAQAQSDAAQLEAEKQALKDAAAASEKARAEAEAAAAEAAAAKDSKEHSEASEAEKARAEAAALEEARQRDVALAELDKAKQDAEARVAEREQQLAAQRESLAAERSAAAAQQEAEATALAQERAKLEEARQAAAAQRAEEEAKLASERAAFQQQMDELEAQRKAATDELAAQRKALEEQTAAMHAEAEKARADAVAAAEAVAEARRVAALEAEKEKDQADTTAKSSSMEKDDDDDDDDEDDNSEEDSDATGSSSSDDDNDSQASKASEKSVDAAAEAAKQQEAKEEEARRERENAEREEKRARDRAAGFHAGRHSQSLAALLESSGFNTAGEETDVEGNGGIGGGGSGNGDGTGFEPDRPSGSDKENAYAEADGEDAPESSAATLRLCATAENLLPDKGEAKNGTSATTDGGDGADINEKTATGASDNTSDPKVTGYSPGSRVELFGLNRKPELNGAKGSVLVYVPDSERYSVVVDGGRGTFDLRPQNLRPTQEVDPTAPEMAAAQEASTSADGLCRGCRSAARQWQAVLKSRRDKLNTMPVANLRKLATDTSTDTAGCTGKGDVVTRLLNQSRRPRSSPTASSAFRSALGEWAGHKDNANHPNNNNNNSGGAAGAAGSGSDDASGEAMLPVLPGLHVAAAAGHYACCASFLRRKGDGSACGPGPGRRVKLQGLKAKPALNGATGAVLGFNITSCRYSVQVDDDKGTFDLQAINLVTLPTAAAEAPPDATATNSSDANASPSSSAAAAAADLGDAHSDPGGPVEEWLGGLEVDAAGRSALYHAALEQRGPKSDVARLLLSAAPSVLDLADENGDTVAHAAAAFSPTTLALVLQRASLEDEAAQAAAVAAGAQASDSSSDGASSKWKAAAAAATASTSLATNGKLADRTNLLGMRPSHLASSLQVLQLLHSYEGDLASADGKGRTPLFIACALGRHDCATFLCDILRHDDDYLRKADERGDSPLHAAACNGSVACTRLLLEYGVEPDVVNQGGLRPVDLAARRGMQDCERLLAEYHMHHGVDSGAFDSVLFLSTLEGLRKARLAVGNNDAPYEILRKAKATELSSQRSAWSLRRARSMRVQQWGSWIAYEDAEMQQVFWYNPKSEAHSWNPPEEVLDMQNRSRADLLAAGNNLRGRNSGDPSGIAEGAEGLQASKAKFGSAQWKSLHMGSMRLKQVGAWVQYTGPGGKPFYFNEETGFFQWERPVGVGSFAEGDPPPGSGANPASNNDTANGGGATSGGGSSPGGGNNGEEEYGDEAWAYTDADATGNGGGGNGGGGYEWQGGGGGGPAEPIGPWAQYPDEEGYYYWYNHDTGASSWDPPNADGGSNGKDEGYGDEYNWDPNETYEGGYWDEQGEWVDTTGEEGYYEGYYDEAGEWVQYEED